MAHFLVLASDAFIEAKYLRWFAFPLVYKGCTHRQKSANIWLLLSPEPFFLYSYPRESRGAWVEHFHVWAPSALIGALYFLFIPFIFGTKGVYLSPEIGEN